MGYGRNLDSAAMINKAIIVGNLGKDPETRTFQNGGKVCNMTVATSERWKDKKSGEWKDRTEWHNVAIMDEKLVTFAENNLRKGSKVYLEGQIQTRKWQDKSGADRYSTEIVLRPFNSTLQLLSEKPKQEEPQGGYASMDDGSEIPF